MNQSILAIDDEPDLLRLLERIITGKTKYQITTTSNSLEVPKLLEQYQYDVIIVDLKMPGLDGMDILKLVKEKKRFEQVIMLTAFGSLESAIEALSQGVFDYITKPFKKEQIIYTIDRAMRFQHTAHEAAYLSDIFEIEPYEEAQKAFFHEYLRRLSARCQDDEQIMSKVSGLSLEMIQAVIKKYRYDIR